MLQVFSPNSPPRPADHEAGKPFSQGADLNQAQRHAPSASVHFITARDGFTLEELVGYHDKPNEAHQNENRNGANVARSLVLRRRPHAS